MTMYPRITAEQYAADRARHAAARLPLLAEAHVVVVGDVMLDRYIYGSVERISPEAPVPVLAIERETSTLGGAGGCVQQLLLDGQQQML